MLLAETFVYLFLVPENLWWASDTITFCLTFRFLTHYSTLLESCVDNSRNRFGSFSLQHWLERQSSRHIYRFCKRFHNTTVFIHFRSHPSRLISKSICFLLQTVFIISVCNNQLLDWVENELIYILSFVPGFASALPELTTKLRLMKEKYLVASPPVTSDINVTFFVVTLYLGHYRFSLFCILMFSYDCSLGSGQEMGSFFCIGVEWSCVADAFEFFRPDCNFNCTEIPQEATGRRTRCVDQQVVAELKEI